MVESGTVVGEVNGDIGSEDSEDVNMEQLLRCRSSWDEGVDAAAVEL